MLRLSHSVPGLLLALLVVAAATTGAILSFEPLRDRFASPVVASGSSVAALAEAVAARHQSVDSIEVRSTGAVTVSYSDADLSGVEQVDPVTGASLGPFQPSGFTRFMTNLHRSFLLGDAGRAGAGLAALTTLVLTVSGLGLLARRLGGWGALLRPIRGTAAQRWHGELARLAAAGLLLTALTGFFMSAETFGLVPETASVPPASAASGGAPAPVGSLAGLRAVDLSALRQLTFPAAGDPTDAFTLRTTEGEARIDAATGAVLAFVPLTRFERIGAVVRTLHTGRGVWPLAIWLGLSAACVPALAFSGSLVWWRRRAGVPRLSSNVGAASADTVILVGSEGNATWAFAGTLHRALTEAGHRVHTAAMNDLAAVHTRAARLLVLTSTYGDGAAPQSGREFLTRLASVETRVPVAVLGFGDRTYPHFCAFAQDVADALDAKGWPRLLPLARVDRQSAQEFAQWGVDLGVILGHDLALEHVVAHPKTSTLELVGREDYGVAIGAPVAILRFRAARGRLPEFEAGDLIGIVAPGSPMPRFYSLASSTRDDVLEICVRLREGGLCSTFLHGLAPGGRIEAFVRRNPSFRPSLGPAPLILIGAGAGIGPLAGFVRANRTGRPVHLYWGGRSPSSDFLYEHELARHLAEKRLTSLATAFSRTREGIYVQDRLAADAPRLRELVRQGAQVLVCGGREMAQAVTHTLNDIVRPLGLDLATLKATGRYVEDVY